MATKASRIALSASNLSSTGNITADLFDDIDSINFLRSDESDTMTGNLSVSGNVGIGTASVASPLIVNVGTDQNLEVDSANSELRLSSVNDARSLNPAIRFQA
jgi:hypothetical protein